jgi:hypothetical protein
MAGTANLVPNALPIWHTANLVPQINIFFGMMFAISEPYDIVS